MARPMNPLPPSGDLAAFASALRDLRAAAGTPTLEEMEIRGGVSQASLSQAHGGRKRPTWPTTKGYVTACGGSIHQWRQRWENLRLSQHASPRHRHGGLIKQWARTGVTPPRDAADEAELVSLLAAVRDFSGLSLRQLARHAPGYTYHTYGALLRGERPVTADILRAFLTGCRVSGPEALEPWLHLLALIRPQEAPHAAKVLNDAHEERSRAWGRNSTQLLEAVQELEKRHTILRSATSVSNAPTTSSMRWLVIETVRRLAECAMPPGRPRNGLVPHIEQLMGDVRDSNDLTATSLDRLLKTALYVPAERQRVRRALLASTKSLKALAEMEAQIAEDHVVLKQRRYAAAA